MLNWPKLQIKKAVYKDAIMPPTLLLYFQNFYFRIDEIDLIHVILEKDS